MRASTKEQQPLPWSGLLKVAVTLLGLLTAAPGFGVTIITVTNISDSGPGSLRNAIATAPNGALINFNLTYPATILVSTPLTLGPSVNIAGPGPSNLTISGGDAVSVFIVNAGANVQISGLAIQHGSSLLGGGIFNAGTLALNNVVVSLCTMGNQLGGGIFNSGTLTLTSSQVSDNSAGNPDGEGEPGGGGGIYNFGGTITISQSQISGNVAEPGVIIDNEGSQSGEPGQGGGVFSTNSASGTVGTVSINQSSILTNQPTGIEAFAGTSVTVAASTIASSGKGIQTDNAAQVTVTNSTIALNTLAINSGGSVVISFSTIADNLSGVSASLGQDFGGATPGSITFKASILSNQIQNCLIVFRPPLGPGISSDGYNLSSDDSCTTVFVNTGDVNNTSADLDPGGLRNNGGPTQTIALLAGSPAIDAIPVNACTDVNGNPVTQDQRGVPRPQGPACDMGAFEYFPSKLLSVAVEVFQITDSVEALSLTPEQQQNLDDPLQAAVDSVNRGETIPASNQLGAFINQANALVRGGVLTQGQGSGLTAQAQAAIQSLAETTGSTS